MGSKLLKNVLEAFAGTGGLGIEALSRGAHHVTFIDKNYTAIKAIKKNLELLGAQEGFNVVRGNFFKTLPLIARKGYSFHLVFIDPPYGEYCHREMLNSLVSYGLLKNQAMIVYETSPRQEYSVVPGFQIVKSKVYGNTKIYFTAGRLNHFWGRRP